MSSSVMSNDLRRELVDVIRTKVHNVQFGHDENHSILDAAVILISAGLVGSDPMVLADFTQLDPEFVRKTAERFEKAGTWARASSERGWFEDCATPFWLEVYAGCEPLT